MGRPPLVLETWGKIRRTTVNGRPTAVANYRDSDGVTRKMQRQGPTLAAAERSLIEALKARVAPTGETITRESTLAELATVWLGEIGKLGRASQTIRRYRSTVNAHINASVGAVKIREATPPRLQRFVDRVAEKSGPGAAQALGVVLNGMMSLAVRYGAVDVSPARELRTPTATRRRVRAPSVEDVRALRTAVRGWDAQPPYRGAPKHDLADLVDVMLGTGCRPGEALALRWDDIDLDRGRVMIEATVIVENGVGAVRQDAPKSDASRRQLALPGFVRDVLVRRRVDAYCEWVFPSSTGTVRRPETVQDHWRSALDGTELAWMTPKDCRKAVATVLGVADAQLQLGHADPAITSKHYVERPLERPDMAARLDVFAV